MLSWANAVAGWWTSWGVTMVQRQQRAMLNAAFKAMRPPKRPARRRK